MRLSHDELGECFLLQDFNIEIRDRIREENLVANHLSQIKRIPSDPTPPIDDNFFMSIFFMYMMLFLGLLTWLIIWLLVFCLHILLEHMLINLRVALSIMNGMILIYSDSAVTRWLGDVCLIIISILLFTFVIYLYVVDILCLSIQLGKCLTLNYIGLCSFMMNISFADLVSNARAQWISPNGMRCHNSPYHFVRFFMYKVLIS